MEYLIISPHCDDEIIGCYKILTSNKCVIIYDGNTPQNRREEAQKLRDHVNIKIQLYQYSIPANFINKETIIFSPDPIYELHPLHRKWGYMCEQIARDGFNVIFYNTNMNSPYIHEVRNPDGKESLLNTVYESQKDLWKYEKKYILFEGYCQWLF